MHFVKNICSFYYFMNCRNVDEKIFKGENSFEILQTIGLIENI